MKYDSTFSEGIHASVKTMHKMLSAAANETTPPAGTWCSRKCDPL